MIRTSDSQRRRERLLAAVGLALGAAVGVAAAMALSGCAPLSVPPATVNHVSEAQRTLMLENFMAVSNHWTVP